MESIPNFFAGRSVFITGATGFMGKVLVEKLLRSCPDIKSIYILVRKSKGKTPEERVEDVLNLQLFDRLKAENPSTLRKVIPLLGDVTELGLGLSESTKDLLIQNVSIIFNSAASVRFNDTLKRCILVNTRSSREIVQLALHMKNLIVLVHISTAYSNCDRLEVGEKLYPSHGNWKQLINIAENLDDSSMNVLTPKVLGNLPNTYTFAKSLAEHVVYDLCSEKIPVIIYRPSIVFPSIEEPIPGWVDNFNGPMALSVAFAKGVMRVLYADTRKYVDFIPVDHAIDGIIVATWLKGTTKDLDEKQQITFYNCTGGFKLTMKTYVDAGLTVNRKYPVDDAIWYPQGFCTNCKFYYHLCVLFLQLVPAVLLDLVLYMRDKKPMFVKLQRRIYEGNNSIYFFMSTQFNFLNEKFLGLEKKLLPEDQGTFKVSTLIGLREYYYTGILGIRKYLLKEDISKLEEAKAHCRKLHMLDMLTKVIFFVIFFFLIYKLYESVILRYNISVLKSSF